MADHPEHRDESTDGEEDGIPGRDDEAIERGEEIPVEEPRSEERRDEERPMEQDREEADQES